MLRFALPRYRPRYIAVTYLVTDPTPARASDPLFAAAWLALSSCNQAGAAEARFASCALLCLVTDLVT